MKTVYVVYKVVENDLEDVKIYIHYKKAKEFTLLNNEYKIWERVIEDENFKNI